MELNSISAIVTGGASGLGKARTFFFEKKKADSSLGANTAEGANRIGYPDGIFSTRSDGCVRAGDKLPH